MHLLNTAAALLVAVSTTYTSLACAASADAEGYYAVVRLISAEQKERNVDDSVRSGVSALVSGDDSTHAQVQGYRYLDRGRQDEKMKASLVSRRILQGACWTF
ncbi:hypothetical protein SAMN05216487_4004 [Pseudomonas sp. UC 17F4]|uniref:hypothetical protein n=1 Tax=Pseudomonas sp. UC 17F4 TaxID=1855328 RepID=UPI000883DE99|nr:hypothetical protein [Pseudomonas sp. UC 17F4]SDQ80756.1 hypothetical protein SAMN05216487_4004 [Pseudomonas sp. UC 17F4]